MANSQEVISPSQTEIDSFSIDKMLKYVKPENAKEWFKEMRKQIEFKVMKAVFDVRYFEEEYNKHMKTLNEKGLDERSKRDIEKERVNQLNIAVVQGLSAERTLDYLDIVEKQYNDSSRSNVDNS